MATARDLADRFHRGWLATYPFDASLYGIPGYDDRVPDDSEAGDATWRSTVEGVLAEAHVLSADDLPAADAVTLGCVVALAEQEIAQLDSAAVEYTVSAMPFRGPAQMLAVAARSTLPDAAAAAAYLERLRRSGAWIDQQAERLRAGAGKGRLPVAPLVELAITWADRVLASDVPEAVSAPQPPPGWDGQAAWQKERDAVAVDVVTPALRRWVELLRQLLPQSRPGEQAGLTHLPGGDADYLRAIRLHTTLPVTAAELHQIGLDEIMALEARAVSLGAQLGLSDLDAVRAALRASAGRMDSQAAIAAAVQAVRRAEEQAAQVFPPPLPAPCQVAPMPAVVASSGAAPHYSPPKLDGSRPGTYWFNTLLPTAGTGWDLEGVAFHEAVPGHHLQLSRVQLLTDIPEVQRQRSFTVFSEGWGLYAEQLAEEMGLYSGTEGLLGAITASLMRAARLVVDTGLHAEGWSRDRARDFFVEHVPMPPEFLAAEIDRYIMWPGQALAYLTGKREILEARDRARQRLGARFSLPDFHAALLDRGSLPMPVMHRCIETWVESY